MIGRGGGGDFLVLRASDYDVYNSDIFALSATLPNGKTVKPDSVETLVIDSRAAANDPAVIQKIQGAEEIFIAGGDQSNYVNFWKDSPVETEINAAAATRGVPIGGTSAGLAIMSGFSFTAQAGTVTSKEVLRDPYDHRVALGTDFLSLSPYLNNVLTEQHIVPRDRMGRFVTFLARLNNPDGLATAGTQARGIGIDQEAALLVEPDGHSTLVAYPDGQPHYAYFLQPTGAAEVCAPKTALTYENIPVHRITTGESFELSTWTGPGGIDYLLSAVDGQLSSNRPDGAIY